MGDSHFKSHIKAFNGTEKISGFNSIASLNSITATVLIANTSVTAPTISGTTSVAAPTVTGSTGVIGTSYLRVGSNKYIFSTTTDTEASVVAAATALVATPIKGSLSLGRGAIWYFDGDAAATKISSV